MGVVGFLKTPDLYRKELSLNTKFLNITGRERGGWLMYYFNPIRMNSEASQDQVQLEAEQAIRPVFKELSEDQKTKVDQLKAKGIELHALIGSCPPSREASVAKTKLEEAIMWAVKGVTK